MTGNRGILHDDARRIVRRHASKAWITCVLEWRGRRRQVMTGRSWTELFFLDEVTALAAGHRPCAYCRRADYHAFVTAWSRGNPALAPTTGRRAVVVDGVLHAERRHPDGSKRTHWRPVESLPPGAMFLDGEQPYLVIEPEACAPWSFSGYGPWQRRPGGMVEVLTPGSTVEALRAGYQPQRHRSAGC